MLAATVPDQHQRTGAGTLGGRPEHARDVADGEQLSADAVGDGVTGDSHCGITPAFRLAPQANYPVTSLETVMPADVRSAASAVLAFAVGQAPGDTPGLCRIPAETGRLKWHPAGQGLFEAGL